MENPFDSVKEYFSQKARNPILTTIIIVWLFKNWRLIFGLLNFDKKATQKSKIAFIEEYYAKNDFYIDLFNCVIYSFAVLAITYFILILSRFIVDGYNNIISPWLSKLIKGKTVTMEIHSNVLDSLEEYRIKYLTEKDLRNKIETERDQLGDRVKDLINENLQIDNLNSTNIALTNQIKELEPIKNDFDNLLKENESNVKKIQSLNIDISTLKQEVEEIPFLRKKVSQSEDKYNDLIQNNRELLNKPNVDNLIAMLENMDLLNSFVRIGKKIMDSTLVEGGSDNLEIEDLHLIVSDYHASEVINGRTYFLYKFTTIGREVYEKLTRIQ